MEVNPLNKKGSILELKRSFAVVMTEDCRFVYVKRQEEMFVGQQIRFSEKDIFKSRKNILKYTKLVACFFIVIFVSSISMSSLKIYSNENVYAYVDIDINPSLEVSIDKNNKVLSAKFINEDGKVLLQDLDLKGKTLEVAIDEIINKARDNGYIKSEIDNYILISASLNPESIEYKNNLSEEEEKLSNLMDSFKGTTGEKRKERVIIEAINTFPETKKHANENEISSGKYYLYSKAKDMGLNLSIGDIRSSSISDIFKALNIDLNDNDKKNSNNKEIDTQSNSKQMDNAPINKKKTNPELNVKQGDKPNNDSTNKSTVNSSENKNSQISSIPNWIVGKEYDVGAIVYFNDNSYKCIQKHTAEKNWNPPNVPALWQKQVSIDSNNTWQTAVNYNAGISVIYNGDTYKCIQGHMSMQGREPINTPALWAKQ